MEELVKLSEESIYKYFDTLSKIGYVKYSDVNTLLVLLYIEETLSNEFSNFITEDDYMHIMKALECLYGSNCILGIPKYANYDELIHKSNTYLIPRVTEDNVLRVSQNNMLKIEV